MAPDLSIIIVPWNCRDELAACLRALDPGRCRVACETIVVDNASRDGTARMVVEQFPGVLLIANEENRGFAAANNQGLAQATGRHVLFLNPDTVVHDDALEALVRTLDGDESIGACGPQLLNADGSIQPSVREFPTFPALLYQYTPLRALGLGRGAYQRYKARGFDFTRPADVASLMGAALCVPRRVLDRVGPFDERFFVYFEEVDLCRRIADAGLRVRFVPEARITHLGGASAEQGPASFYLFRSMFRYLKKHHGLCAAWSGLAALWLGLFVREAFQLPVNLAGAAVLALLGQADRAGRRWARVRAAARFVGLDAWRLLIGA
jgi:GT2 family glycosyltransferase